MRISSSVKETFVSGLIAVGGLKPFELLNRGKLRILTYHRFSSRPTPFATSSETLESHLKYLRRRANVISLDNAVESLRLGDTLPANATVITIDDGYSDAFEIAFPLLKRYAFPATIYAVTDFIENLTWMWPDITRYIFLSTARDELTVDLESFGETFVLGCEEERISQAARVNSHLKTLDDRMKTGALASVAAAAGVSVPEIPPERFSPFRRKEAIEMDKAGIRVESHTKSHPILTKVDNSRVQIELAESKAFLEELLQREVCHFCYPNGNYDDSVVRSVQEAGYRSAVSTNFGFCDMSSFNFELPRIDAEGSTSSLLQNFTGFESFKGAIRSVRRRNVSKPKVARS